MPDTPPQLDRPTTLLTAEGVEWRKLPRKASGHRTSSFRCRITPADLALIQRRAAEAGLSLTEYVVRRSLGRRLR